MAPMASRNVISGFFVRAVVFQAGGNPALAEDFLRFLAGEGWLAHWLTFAGDQYLPPMRKLLDQPFWLDPRDPHRMRAAIQILTKTHQDLSTGMVRDYDWRSQRIWDENVWARPSTASSPRASPPSRRSTRRSPGSSKYSKSSAFGRSHTGAPSSRHGS
jgi:hypothetical protein